MKTPHVLPSSNFKKQKQKTNMALHTAVGNAGRALNTKGRNRAVSRGIIAHSAKVT
jgi:hypothetical protein